MKKLIAVALLLPCLGFAEAFTVVRQSLQQGGFWLAEVAPSTTVSMGGKALPVVPDSANGKAYVLAAFDRFEPAVRWLKICAPEGECVAHKLAIQPRTYATQNVKGAPKAQVDPDEKALKRMAADNRAIGAARATALQQATQQLGFTQPFRKPGGGPTSGVYGSRRLFDGKERSWHKGHDFVAKTGTPVYAPASGIVRLARDTFMSGNLVMVDHGGGLSTAYAHLSKIDVVDGQVVTAGDKLGEVGSTGRSSGPHLHWGMYYGQIAIDPALWLGAF